MLDEPLQSGVLACGWAWRVEGPRTADESGQNQAIPWAGGVEEGVLGDGFHGGGTGDGILRLVDLVLAVRGVVVPGARPRVP